MSEFEATENQRSSYRPKGYGMSAGLLRARRRFFVPNVFTGFAIASFAVGVWAYSMSAVKQDTFDDVDEQWLALNATAVDVPSSDFSQSERPGGVTSESSLGQSLAASTSSSDLRGSGHPRGLIYAMVGERHPWLFEPNQKTLVWGAPPVDNIGQIRDKLPVEWKK